MEQVTNNYYYGNPDIEDDDDESLDINWIAFIKKLKQHRKDFFISLPIAFILACVYMMAQPNYYNVEVKLAPELGTSSTTSSGLSSLMSSLKLGSLNQSGGDAVTVTSYPDLMNSKTFLVSLFNVKVQNQDSTINTTYFNYLSKHQKKPWWSKAMGGVMKSITSFFKTKNKHKEGPVNPFYLTREQDAITKAIGKKIVCDVDQKTAIITINVTDQDPVICATMADSACVHLQNFITDYRTKKSRQELENIQVQVDKTRREYEIAKDKLGAFNNANWAIVNEDQKLEQQFLQNDMNLKYTAYSTFTNQLIAARTKLEASRPVFTILDGASVPLRKTGPKRGMSVIIFCFVVFFLHSLWILRMDLKEQFFPKSQQTPKATVPEAE